MNMETLVERAERLGVATATVGEMLDELERLRKIEAAAVACSEHPVWNDDQFYGLMTELQRALRGEVGADKTANATVQAAGGALSARSPGTTG